MVSTKKKLTKTKKRKRRILGWREWVHLPELKMPRIKAKVDSGARTSALHAENIVFFRRSGRRMIRFRIYPHQFDRFGAVTREARLVEMRAVRNSTGQISHRPVIRTELEVGDEVWPIEVTLVDREIMGFRMLIGREAIRRRFLIDPGLSYLNGKAKHGRTGS